MCVYVFLGALCIWDLSRKRTPKVRSNFSAAAHARFFVTWNDGFDFIAIPVGTTLNTFGENKCAVHLSGGTWKRGNQLLGSITWNV